MKKLTGLILAGAMASSSAMAMDGDLTGMTKSMTLDTAATIATKTIESCREMGIPVGVTVLDRMGRTLVIMRDLNAPSLTLEISEKKAYTALSFNVKTSALKERSQSVMAYVDSLYLGAGGAPVEAAGSVLGAVGVSGAPDGMDDEKCAIAGIEAVQADLEME